MNFSFYGCQISFVDQSNALCEIATAKAEFESYLQSMHQPRSVAPIPSGDVLIMLTTRIIYFKTKQDFVQYIIYRYLTYFKISLPFLELRHNLSAMARDSFCSFKGHVLKPATTYRNSPNERKRKPPKISKIIETKPPKRAKRAKQEKRNEIVKVSEVISELFGNRLT